MVDIKRKKLIIWSSIIVVVLLVSVGGFFGYKYISDNDSDSIEIPNAQSTEEIAKEVEKRQSFNSLAEIATSNDANAKLEASYAFAKNIENNQISRLDAYRLCMQSAQELSDLTKADICYQEAIVLANSLVEVRKTYWLKYLEEVKTGNITEDSTDDGSQ
jgi:hypothetical protein